MGEFDEMVLKYFLEHQNRLFDEKVADTPAEAETFLEDCMAVVCRNLREVKEYLDESGADVTGMSEEDLKEAAEVFALPDGRYLVVEA